MSRLYYIFIVLCCFGCANATIYYNDDGSPDYDKINEELQKQNKAWENAENDLPIDYTRV